MFGLFRPSTRRERVGVRCSGLGCSINKTNGKFIKAAALVGKTSAKWRLRWGVDGKRRGREGEE